MGQVGLGWGPAAGWEGAHGLQDMGGHEGLSEGRPGTVQGPQEPQHGGNRGDGGPAAVGMPGHRLLCPARTEQGAPGAGNEQEGLVSTE